MAELFLRRPAVDLSQSTVDANHPELTIDECETDRRALLERLDQRERLAGHALRLHQLGDVLHGTDQMRGATVPLLGDLENERSQRTPPPGRSIR